jgi:hypothetical protein
MSSPLDQLTDEIREVALLVHSAQERAEDREIVKSAHLAVERLSKRYKDLSTSGPEGERENVERKLGRRVTDLRRLASMLPRIGSIASGHTGDQASTGPSRVQERRITGVSWRSEAPLGATIRPALRVGGEIDGWCGPCDSLTTHHIIAMVGDNPKQVVCQSCGGRHGYRTTPARKASSESDSAPSSTPRETDASRRAEQKATELRALGQELADAANVRVFNARERYKVGEVISHPEYGRGKVETVLRSSLLARFPNGGLKSLMLS